MKLRQSLLVMLALSACNIVQAKGKIKDETQKQIQQHEQVIVQLMNTVTYLENRVQELEQRLADIEGYLGACSQGTCSIEDAPIVCELISADVLNN